MKTNKEEQTCLAFLIPFAPRSVKSNWHMACAQLRQTLASIQNSSSQNYCVVVAGHEAPDFEVNIDSRFHYISFPKLVTTHENRGVAVRLDKLEKIEACWNYAKLKWNPKYVMKLDADDFVSSRLVGWLERSGSEAGYLIQQGWLWTSGARHLIQSTETLDRVCGSCLLIRSDQADKLGPFLTEVEGMTLGEEGSRFASRDHYSLVPGSGISTLLLNDSHQRYKAQFAHLGYKLPSLPFRGVAYRAGNTDSITRITGDSPPLQTLRMMLGRIRRTRLITPRLRKEFMLVD